MATLLGVEKELGIKQVRDYSVHIEDNIGKLMYYLGCISSCLDDVIPSQVTNYSRVDSLTEEEKAKIVEICILVSPDVLNNQVIFLVDNENPLLEGTQV